MGRSIDSGVPGRVEKRKVEGTMLKICYLSDDPRRLKNYRQILEEMETEEALYRNHRMFRTENVEYRFVNCGNPDTYMGLYADQVIIDFRNPMIEIARIITAASCVPDEYKIIDDRKIGVLDF